MGIPDVNLNYGRPGSHYDNFFVVPRLRLGTTLGNPVSYERSGAAGFSVGNRITSLML